MVYLTGVSPVLEVAVFNEGWRRTKFEFLLMTSTANRL